MVLRAATIFFCVALISAQKNPHWLDDKSAIVHLFEWKWKDIADECERFLQHTGYGGVQISPANENLIVAGRPWWERYQQLSFKIDTRSGNEDEFLDMTTRCNRVGIRIYVDVVFNHMTGKWENATGIAGTKADTFTNSYPAIPFTNEHFHKICQISDEFNLTQMRNCELFGLNDLDQSLSHVRQKFIDLLDRFIDLGVAGFRIDAARHMWPEDLKYIYENLKNLNTSFGFSENSRPFIYQEVSGFEDDKLVFRNQYTQLGVVTEFRICKAIKDILRNEGRMKELEDWGKEWSPSDSTLSFVDNHDVQRGVDQTFLSYKTPKKYIMANAFLLAYPYGIQRVMSSFDFDQRDQGPPHNQDESILSPRINPEGSCEKPWICEHRWPEIVNMVQFRNVAENVPVRDFWSDGNRASFCREKRAFVAFTNKGNLDRTLQTCLPAGKYCDIISGKRNPNGTCTGKTVQVQSDGFALIQIGENEKNGVLALHVEARI